jgi:hypothetical protein
MPPGTFARVAALGAALAAGACGGTEKQAASECTVGTATSLATDGSLDLFGEVVSFGGGADLPAGRYRVTYVDGCMKYSSTQAWTIHAYASGSSGWWLVGASTADKVLMPPGTVGYATSNGAYAAFADCVAANLALPPAEFDFAGGPLGVWLQDSPYTDNVAGEGGRNPKWSLTLLAPCRQ